MEEAAEVGQRPVICRRIKETRKRLQQEWQVEHPGEPDNPFNQKEVASRIPGTTRRSKSVTEKTYAKWENTDEPNLLRLRQIALALKLDEDYFLPSGDLATATLRVEAEADRLRALGDEFQGLLTLLRAQIRAGDSD